MNVRDAVYCLANNDISFIPSFTDYEFEKVIEMVRKSPLKDLVISACFESLSKAYPYYAFRIVYDMEEYEVFCEKYLDENLEVFNKNNRFYGYFFIGSSKWSLEYIKNNIGRLKELDNNIIFITLRYAMDMNNEELINLLLLSDDLDLRGKSMVEFMEMSPFRFMNFYDDLLKAFVKFDEKGNIKQLMDEKYVSRLAYSIVDNNLSMEKYEQVKDFILKNYPSNSLAERLDGVNVDEELGIEYDEYLDVLFKDMDELFSTSGNYKFRLFVKYPDKISEDLRNKFGDAIRDFIKIDEEIVEHMFKVGLGDKFLEFTQKYMELSTGAKVVGDAGIGSATRSFIVGDYVVKCSYKKWLAVKCPDLYLIAKNYEEEIVKSRFGSVIGALEVQKYYHKSVNPTKHKLFGKFYEALEALGYTFDDNVLGFNDTPNFFYLDSYKDADCEDPESLPKWFKKEPIVLVDRDYVHKIKR